MSDAILLFRTNIIIYITLRMSWLGLSRSFRGFPNAKHAFAGPHRFFFKKNFDQTSTVEL
jgi:hypothetical protein